MKIMTCIRCKYFLKLIKRRLVIFLHETVFMFSQNSVRTFWFCCLTSGRAVVVWLILTISCLRKSNGYLAKCNYKLSVTLYCAWEKNTAYWHVVRLIRFKIILKRSIKVTRVHICVETNTLAFVRKANTRLHQITNIMVLLLTILVSKPK